VEIDGVGRVVDVGMGGGVSRLLPCSGIKMSV
jgi:hypothetical protein